MKRLTKEKAESYWRKGRHPTKYTSRHTFQEVADRLAAYEDTGLTPETVAQLKQIAEIFNCDPADPAQLKALCVKLQEMAQTERDGRLVVLVNEVTVDELHALFRKLNEQNEQQGDCAETYTTGYRNGHRNGQIELLVRLLGFPDPHGGVTEAAVERMKGAGEHG